MKTALTREKVIVIMRSHRHEMQSRFTVRTIGVFGSTIRGEAKPDSDVDVLVDMAEPTFNHYMDLKFYLEDLLGRKVDLVLTDTVKPRLLPYIEKEIVHV